MAKDGYNGAVERKRNPWFTSREKQETPKADNRSRINASTKFYVAHLLCGEAGCTLNVNEFAERVKYREHGQTYVMFEGKKHVLNRSERFVSFVEKFTSKGVRVYVGGVDTDSVNEIAPYPYIYVVSKDEYLKFKKFYLNKKS